MQEEVFKTSFMADNMFGAKLEHLTADEHRRLFDFQTIDAETFIQWFFVDGKAYSDILGEMLGLPGPDGSATPSTSVADPTASRSAVIASAAATPLFAPRQSSGPSVAAAAAATPATARMAAAARPSGSDDESQSDLDEGEGDDEEMLDRSNDELTALSHKSLAATAVPTAALDEADVDFGRYEEARELFTAPINHSVLFKTSPVDWGCLESASELFVETGFVIPKEFLDQLLAHTRKLVIFSTDAATKARLCKTLRRFEVAQFLYSPPWGRPRRGDTTRKRREPSHGPHKGALVLRDDDGNLVDANEALAQLSVNFGNIAEKGLSRKQRYQLGIRSQMDEIRAADKEASPNCPLVRPRTFVTVRLGPKKLAVALVTAIVQSKPVPIVLDESRALKGRLFHLRVMGHHAMSDGTVLFDVRPNSTASFAILADGSQIVSHATFRRPVLAAAEKVDRYWLALAGEFDQATRQSLAEKFSADVDMKLVRRCARRQNTCECHKEPDFDALRDTKSGCGPSSLTKKQLRLFLNQHAKEKLKGAARKIVLAERAVEVLKAHAASGAKTGLNFDSGQCVGCMYDRATLANEGYTGKNRKLKCSACIGDNVISCAVSAAEDRRVQSNCAPAPAAPTLKKPGSRKAQKAAAARDSPVPASTGHNAVVPVPPKCAAARSSSAKPNARRLSECDDTHQPLARKKSALAIDSDDDDEELPPVTVVARRKRKDCPQSPSALTGKSLVVSSGDESVRVKPKRKAPYSEWMGSVSLPTAGPFYEWLMEFELVPSRSSMSCQPRRLLQTVHIDIDTLCHVCDAEAMANGSSFVAQTQVDQRADGGRGALFMRAAHIDLLNKATSSTKCLLARAILAVAQALNEQMPVSGKHDQHSYDIDAVPFIMFVVHCEQHFYVAVIATHPTLPRLFLADGLNRSSLPSVEVRQRCCSVAAALNTALCLMSKISGEVSPLTIGSVLFPPELRNTRPRKISQTTTVGEMFPLAPTSTWLQHLDEQLERTTAAVRITAPHFPQQSDSVSCGVIAIAAVTNIMHLTRHCGGTFVTDRLLSTPEPQAMAACNNLWLFSNTDCNVMRAGLLVQLFSESRAVGWRAGCTDFVSFKHYSTEAVPRFVAELLAERWNVRRCLVKHADAKSVFKVYLSRTSGVSDTSSRKRAALDH